MRAPTQPSRDRGSVTIAMAFAVTLIMVITVQVSNVMVFQFGRSAVRGALDEGARNGARATPGTEIVVCEQLARNALDDLAAGLGRGVTIRCSDTGTSVVATADVHFDGWMTSVADHDSTMTAAAAKANQ